MDGEKEQQEVQQKSSFSFGVAEEFKKETDQDLTFLGQKLQFAKDLNFNQPTQFEKDRQMLETVYGTPIGFQAYEYWKSRSEKLAQEGKAAEIPKLKNPLSFEAQDGTKVEFEPHVKLKKGKIEEVGLKIKGKFDWQKIHAHDKPKEVGASKLDWNKVGSRT
ncbi:MAG: hypothetical protein R3F23_00860 [Verrucomicrobiia bacterium]